MERELVFNIEISSAETAVDFEATIEVNEYAEPVGAEVFGIADSLGAEVAGHTASLLEGVAWRASYDSKVDSLSFAFGDGTRSGGQINGVLHVGLSNGSVVLVQLFKD